MNGPVRGSTRWVPTLALLAALPVAGLGVTAASLPFAPVASANPGCTGTLAGLQVTAGSPQLAKVGTAFADPLEATVVDTGGCPLANEDVVFTAPGTGPSASFEGGLTADTVTTNTQGIATAPALTANDISGSYTVTAQIQNTLYEVSYDLTNTTTGVATTVTEVSGNSQSAAVGAQYNAPLEVSVTDAYGAAVPGATVNFTVVTTSGAGATFVGGGATAAVQTGTDGTATSPQLVAGSTVGTFTVTATVSGVSAPVTFTLTNVASAPTTLAVGTGSSQDAELGTTFAIPLAVTVTDTNGNDVVGASVTFRAPSSGPSGVFAGYGATAVILTDSSGVATAPDFSANQVTGGYIVTASVAGLSSEATFALVNTSRTTASVTGPAGTYWLVTGTGQVLRSGAAVNYGGVTKKLSAPIVAMASMPSGAGYWLVASNGVVYPFGGAASYGPQSKLHLAKPIVGIASTANGKGYWLVAANGQVFNYGDAVNYGSPSKLHLTKAIVGIAATPDGKGYWLVASDGGIFNYGDAAFHGSTGSLHLKKPIVGIAAAPGGAGYWLVASDGGVFGFGRAATFFGSGASLSPKPVKAIVPTSDGDGYWIVSANGTAAGFGDAGAQGSRSSAKTAVVGGAS
jgi:hypothetical protein